mgnify:FL=1
MKKLFTLFAACIFGAVMVYADGVYKYQATSLAFKSQNEYGYWSDWSDWESTNILVVINIDNSRINIYSSSPQEYDIYDYGERVVESDGGVSFTLKCIDEDGLRCSIRQREQPDGQLQLYINYSDVIIVYNIQKK